MCGRIYQTLPLHRLVSIARARMASNPDAYTSSYNVCPTTFIPAIRSNKRFVAEKIPEQKEVQNTQKQDVQEQSESKEQIQPSNEPVESKQPQFSLSFSKWGLRTKQNLITNCRSQQIFMKPTFTKLMKNRCVIIMQGYYEWNTKKQPYLFKNKTQDHILVAGLYNDEDEIVLLTRDAAAGLKQVHHRMPVILSHQQVSLWLNEENNNIITKIVQDVFLGKDKQIWNNIQMTKLAPHVNSIKQKSAKCIMTYEDYKKQLDKNGIMKFFKKKQPQVETVGIDGEILLRSGKKQDENDSQATEKKASKEVDKDLKKHQQQLINIVRQKMNQQIQNENGNRQI